MKDIVYSTPEVEGIERATILFVIPTAAGNVNYRCVRWSRISGHWLLETPDQDQVEIHGAPICFIHIPKPGWTFNLDGTCRELHKDESAVVLQ